MLYDGEQTVVSSEQDIAQLRHCIRLAKAQRIAAWLWAVHLAVTLIFGGAGFLTSNWNLGMSCMWMVVFSGLMLGIAGIRLAVISQPAWGWWALMIAGFTLTQCFIFTTLALLLTVWLVLWDARKTLIEAGFPLKGIAAKSSAIRQASNILSGFPNGLASA